MNDIDVTFWDIGMYAMDTERQGQWDGEEI
jgi:hypothetical protein